MKKQKRSKTKKSSVNTHVQLSESRLQLVKTEQNSENPNMTTFAQCPLSSKPSPEFLQACMKAGLKLKLTPAQVYMKSGLNLYSEYICFEWLKSQLICIQFGWFEQSLVGGAGWDLPLAK